MRNRLLADLINEKLFSNANNAIKKTKKSLHEENSCGNKPSRSNITRDLTLKKIIKTIIKYDIFGINHVELANKIKINPKNLRKYMNILVNEGVVIRKGNKGGYKISPIFSIFNNRYNIENNDFRERLVELLSEHESLLWVLTDSKDESDLQSFKKFLIKRSKGIDEEFTLFEFSNTIGFIFIYLCLFAMNQKNNITKYAQNDEEKDMLVMLWIYDIVSKFCLEWLQQFTLKIPHALKSLSSLDTTEYDKKIESLKPRKRKTKYIYDSVIIEELQKTLKNTYPHLFRRCEVIFIEEPKTKKLHQQKEILIKSCKHDEPYLDKDYIIYDKLSYESYNELFKSHDALRFDLNNVKFVKHCQRCHRNVYSKI